MPYSNPSDLPDSVRKHLPTEAQNLFIKVFNDAYDRDGEVVAFKVAWSVVKKSYEKDASGKWKKITKHKG